MRRGIWIPEWMEKLALPANERMLFAEIVSLHQNGACFASNEYFGKVLGLKQDTITRIIARLKKKGLVHQTKFDGRRRFLAPASDICTSPVKKEFPTVRASVEAGYVGDSYAEPKPISTVQLYQTVHKSFLYEKKSPNENVNYHRKESLDQKIRVRIQKFSLDTRRLLEHILLEGKVTEDTPERIRKIWAGLNVA